MYNIIYIEIETGRYTQFPLEFRLCILCDSNLVEDENHFLYQKVKDLYPEFDVMNNNLNLKYLMSETLVKDRAEYIYCCYCKWSDFIDK